MLVEWVESKVRIVTKRTKKEFKNYNVFHDRPFNLKWKTAFAMDELMKSVRASRNKALKVNQRKEQMCPKEIDKILSEAFLKNLSIELQLNLFDQYGNILDSVRGKFHGEAYREYFVIDKIQIKWEDVRHIELIA